MDYKILQGDNRDSLKTIADNSIDAIVTDPPYGIDFLGKSWDANTGALETYKECLRVLKPGGHIVAFSAARTYHHLAITLEQAGFEIRDQIMWIYSSGFPKSQDVGKQLDKKAGIKHDYVDYHNDQFDTRNVSNTASSKNPHCKKCGKQLGTSNLKCDENPCFIKNPPIQSEWAGWGTSLKPAHEPICLARKPTKLSTAKNVQKYGTGALNIDDCRIPMAEGDKFDIRVYKENQNNEKRDTELTDIEYGEYEIKQPNDKGRFPSNVIGEIADGYQKYFYCPKVSRAERHIGFDLTGIPTDPSGKFDRTEDQPLNANERIESKSGNNHPTVKPIELMKYLIKLITPPGGTVLDPFNGSGSTGCAAVELGHPYIGCELDPAYVEIAHKRITAWHKAKNKTAYKEIFE